MNWKKRSKFRKLLNSKLRKKRWWLWMPGDIQTYADYKRYVRSYCRRHIKHPENPEQTKFIKRAEFNGMPLKEWKKLMIGSML